MREAVMENRIGNRVLPFPDDLSCGPIASDDPASRAAWWGTDLPLTSRFKLAEYDMEPRTEVARPSHPLWPRFPSDPFYAMAEIEPEVRAFWDELESTDAHIVLWFGRMAADELALYLAISERLAERDYSVVDVTALKGMERVATVQPEILTSLLGKERRPAPPGAAAGGRLLAPVAKRGCAVSCRHRRGAGVGARRAFRQRIAGASQKRLAGSHLRRLGNDAPFRSLSPGWLPDAHSTIGRAGREWQS